MIQAEKHSPAPAAEARTGDLPPVPRDRFIEVIEVPAGEFLMGTSDEQIERLLAKEDWAKEWHDRDLFRVEQPQHTVGLPAFAIAARLTTNAEYRLFIWDSGHPAPRSWLGFDYPPGTENNPVVEVSRADALVYCKWLSQETGLAYRLPSEAEWERAARGADGRIYPWGAEFDPWRCNTVESGKRGTTPVGLYSPAGDSLCGAADMAGNVWEWTNSLFRPYPYRADDGREDPAGAGPYVVRGGAWYYSRKLARCASREGLPPNYISPALGFRVAFTPIPSVVRLTTDY
ncbi:MAG: SUMF1/EgtB/PvdO family nonheme iron enzyme [Chloroflexi bacterium]|nr:SUMF1/EgtB/PvdO family nonheme iron enzyme [Chloroflexota bacterium]